MRKDILLFMVVILSLSFASAALTEQGPFKVNTIFDLRQLCDDCTFNNITSVIYPNGSVALDSTAMVQDGTEWTTGFNANVTGTYRANGFGDEGGANTVWAFTFEVTSSGNTTPDNLPAILTGIFIIVFGISCFFLFLCMKSEEPGIKIFFLMASLIFLFGSMMVAANVAQASNVAQSVDDTLGYILFALGMIVLVIISYVIIKQIVVVVDMYRLSKGLSMGSQHFSVPGYDPRRMF